MVGASIEKGHGACGTQGRTEGSSGDVHGDYGDGDSDRRIQWGRLTIPYARQQEAVQDILGGWGGQSDSHVVCPTQLLDRVPCG